MTDVLRDLADVDPARALDPEPDEELLARTLALPPDHARMRRSRRRLVNPVPLLGGVCVLAVGAVLLVDRNESPRPPGPQRSPSLALAAQAYARTSVSPGQILHTLATFTSVQQMPGGKTQHVRGRIEEWHRGRETHRLETYFRPDGRSTAALDHLIDAEGVMRQISKDGSYRIVRKSDNEDAANVIAQQQSGFVEDFRHRYEQGQLDAAGDVRFAGRPATRYVVSARPANRDGTRVQPPSPEQAFYIDRETGEPLGYTSTLRMGKNTLRFAETVRAIERLDPRPENLRKLRNFILPRRRDADGCVRGPITNARQSDTASKRDCGGTPGAIVAR